MTLRLMGMAMSSSPWRSAMAGDPALAHCRATTRTSKSRYMITYTENQVTNSINEADDYRTPLPSEARTYELLKTAPDCNLPDITNLFRFDEMLTKAGQASDGSHDLPYEDIDATGATANHPYRRLIERVALSTVGMI